MPSTLEAASALEELVQSDPKPDQPNPFNRELPRIVRALQAIQQRTDGGGRHFFHRTGLDNTMAGALLLPRRDSILLGFRNTATEFSAPLPSNLGAFIAPTEGDSGSRLGLRAIGVAYKNRDISSSLRLVLELPLRDTDRYAGSNIYNGAAGMTLLVAPLDTPPFTANLTPYIARNWAEHLMGNRQREPFGYMLNTGNPNLGFPGGLDYLADRMPRLAGYLKFVGEHSSS